MLESGDFASTCRFGPAKSSCVVSTNANFQIDTAAVTWYQLAPLIETIKIRESVKRSSSSQPFNNNGCTTWKGMFHTTIAYLAWIFVVLIQAIVHFWIFQGSKRIDDVNKKNQSLDTMNARIDDGQIDAKLHADNLDSTDDLVPPMVPHVQISEDEYDEEPDQETFDGDEPLIFFELLDKTGAEMIKVG